MKESKKNCPHCGGEGGYTRTISAVSSPQHLNRREARSSFSRCSKCNGTGEISRADKYIKEGLSGDDLYQKLIEDGKEKI